MLPRGPPTAIFGPSDERVTEPIGGMTCSYSKRCCRPCMLRDCLTRSSLDEGHHGAEDQCLDVRTGLERREGHRRCWI
jgi:hypothetical protein